MKTLVVFSLIAGLICPGASAQNNDKSNPYKWHSEGLYYYNTSDPNNLFVLIDPSTPNSTKQGGYGQAVAQYYSGGLAKQTNKAILSGANSKTVINDNKPTFYFYFKADNVSPKSFVLVRFIAKKHDRTMIVGSSNAFGASTGIDEKEVVDFTYDKLSDGIFKVYTKDPLPAGEYCFYYTGKDDSPFAGGLYDFGISAQ